MLNIYPCTAMIDLRHKIMDTFLPEQMRVGLWPLREEFHNVFKWWHTTYTKPEAIQTLHNIKPWLFTQPMLASSGNVLVESRVDQLKATYFADKEEYFFDNDYLRHKKLSGFAMVGGCGDKYDILFGLYILFTPCNTLRWQTMKENQELLIVDLDLQKEFL